MKQAQNDSGDPQAQVLHLSFSPRGGAGAVAVRLAAAQRRQGWQIDFESLVESPFPRWAARHPFVAATALIDYYLVRKRASASFYSLFRRQHSRRIGKRISDFRGVLHLHLLNGFLWPPALFSEPLPARKIVWSVQDLWPFTGGCHYANECSGFTEACRDCPQVHRFFRNRVARALQEKKHGVRPCRSLQIVTPSDWARNLVQSSVVMAGVPVDVIPNPVDTSAFSPLDRSVCRARLGMDAQAFVVGVGAADIRDERKQISQTLDVLKGMIQQSSASRPLRVLVFGDGGPLPGFTMPEFCFVGASQSAVVLAEWYNAMDVYVSLSRYETFGNTLAEAAACGTPSICLDRSGMSDVVVHGKTGYHVASRHELREALAPSIQEPSLLKNMGVAARAHAVEQFDDQAVARRFASLYERPVPEVTP